MVNQPFAHHRDGFKPAVWVAGEAGHGVAVVHAPAVAPAEVLAHVAAGQRYAGAHVGIAGRVGVVVLHAEQERGPRGPGKAKRLELHDGGLS